MSSSLSFAEQCYQLLKQLPAGRVTTYKAIANALNSRAYRAVGQAMKHNPKVIETPCHRVILSSGKLGDYVNGTAAKQALLESEGIEFVDGKIKHLAKVLYQFS